MLADTPEFCLMSCSEMPCWPLALLELLIVFAFEAFGFDFCVVCFGGMISGGTSFVLGIGCLNISDMEFRVAM